MTTPPTKKKKKIHHWVKNKLENSSKPSLESCVSVTASLLVCKCISQLFSSRHLRGVYFPFYDTLDSSLPSQADSKTSINNLSPLYALQTPLWPCLLVLRPPGYNGQRHAALKKENPCNGWKQLWQWGYACVSCVNRNLGVFDWFPVSR